ncbi:glycerate kinase type-2 family protein [Mucilaginibacter ginsenosidivorax]|uniref:DUF4147 domain-containing protein n=1 Tax=Mucilaginibacter ginsenosidivorax TaxID=862126 RepID=A0A5B8W954_9SPHI|nr:DUF4147 domain-containing protein [Mucilaginibacter ginsenosidivorax]QEC79967.1 DUF4147 domain-containing protein [Mucilaginibacter ginsenosidivorax]
MIEEKHAIQIFRSAVSAVQPGHLLRQHLSVSKDSLTIGGVAFPKTTINHIYVVGAGKAAAAMAVEAEMILGGYISEGLVTTKYGHALPTSTIRIIEGAHPVPDENCVDAVTQTIKLLKKATKNDIVICLLSGGASALWCDLPPGATLQEVQATFDRLIKSGAAIHEINTVRKHLSNFKGGQLVRACNGASVFSFIISDVPGDDLETIASGPTVPDASTFEDAETILQKYNLLSVLPQSISRHIKDGIKGTIKDTPKPGDPLFDNTVNRIIGNNKMAVLEAANMAKKLGYHVHIVDHLITRDAETEAKILVDMARQYKAPKPVCIIQGGETTVKVTGTGKGGRNQHFTLAALSELNKLRQQNISDEITILSGGTDGTDGPTDATGAVVDNDTLNLVLHRGLLIEEYLKKHDAYHFFKQTNGLIITGPTQTNVMDIMIAIVK